MTRTPAGEGLSGLEGSSLSPDRTGGEGRRIGALNANVLKLVSEIPDHVLQSHDDLVTLRQLVPQARGRRRLGDPHTHPSVLFREAVPRLESVFRMT